MLSTEQLIRQMQHSSQQIVESFSRCTKNGFVAIDEEGKITHFSPIMEEITGYSESEMLGKKSSDLFSSPEDEEFVDDAKEIISQAATLITKKGGQITLPTRKTFIKNEDNPNESAGELRIFITDTYINDIDKVQSDFVSTVSHELRTPITSIKGFASTLLQHRDGLDEEKRKKYIQIIRDQAERLSRLVEDLLAVSRLESNKLQLTVQPLTLKPILENIAIIVESKHNNSHDISITAPDNIPQIWADPDRLEQIFTNLIDNAVKYSPKANNVDVSITKEEYEGETCVVTRITDYGIGIHRKNLSKIFNKFSRLDSPLTRLTEGTGLGLYICYSLVKLLGGELKVESEEGKKTTFIVYLPTRAKHGD